MPDGIGKFHDPLCCPGARAAGTSGAHERPARRPRANRHAARDLHRDQSGPGLRRSRDQGGARPGSGDHARDGAAGGRAVHRHRRARRRRRDRERQERTGRYRLSSVRSGACARGRFLSCLFAGAEHLSGAGRLADSLGCGRRQAGRARRCRRARCRGLFPHSDAEGRRAQAQRGRRLRTRSRNRCSQASSRLTRATACG